MQLWTQIIGKVRMVDTPLLKSRWNVPLHVSATGLTTSLIPHPSGNSFQVDFDLRAHRLEIVTVLGGRRSIPRKSALLTLPWVRSARLGSEHAAPA